MKQKTLLSSETSHSLALVLSAFAMACSAHSESSGASGSAPDTMSAVQNRDRSVSFAVNFTGDHLHNSLTATAEGRTHTVVTDADSQCLRIMAEKDFDEDGYVDALVEHVLGCGGNCCGNAYYFVSYDGRGQFRRSDEFGYVWGDEPSVERWKNRWTVRLVSENMGANTDDVKNLTERYVLEAGKAVAVERWQKPAMSAESELKSSAFDAANPNDEHRVAIDLDGDGKVDEIVATLSFRWGTLAWKVRFANKKTVEGALACKRVGVLQTSTRGVRDLVCDLDTVLRWTGGDYEPVGEQR